MKLQVLSHAGLAVSGPHKTLIVDPWIVGSTYWRSWWNYPPVPREMIDSLKPDFVYLTHIHWDHFHSPSLKKFGTDTPILVPKGHYGRIKRDLAGLGFHRVFELRHGERFEIEPGFSLFSYQFSPFLDSAPLIECEGIRIFNANDCKLMGPPLAAVLRRHPDIDFVLRSHSSANDRLCYDVVDDKKTPLDDVSNYIRCFAAFAQKTKAKYAIPFASNHCFLHKDVFHFNPTIQTPYMVKRYFEENRISSPQLVVMLPGDSWSSRDGFQVSEERAQYFDRREEHLVRYQAANAAKLDEFYDREARAAIALREFERYFGDLCKSIPYVIRRVYRHRPIRFYLSSGKRRTAWELDILNKRVTSLDPDSAPSSLPLEIHASAFVMKHSMAKKFCAQIPISKRVRFRVTAKTKRYIQLLILLMNLYDCELLPIRKNLRYRFFETWFLRWRELLLYARIVLKFTLSREFSEEAYIRET